MLKMKTEGTFSLIYLLLFLNLIPNLVNAQRFSTQDGYEKYFAENFNQLDKFEGIWKKVLKVKIAGDDIPFGQEIKVNVAIIFEGYDNAGNKLFQEYQLVNGRFDPSMSIGKYVKYKDNTAKYIFIGNKNSSDIRYTSLPFYLTDIRDKIEYEFSMKDLSDKSSMTIICAIELYKAFPFEGDIQK
jgi:hypothetical protein